MFTGIITTTGTIKTIERKTDMIHISVDVGKLSPNIKLGDSVCHSGVCLTATAKKGSIVRFDVIKETLKSTTLGLAKEGDLLNLELALTPTTRMGGHFVTGHVDEVGMIKNIVTTPNWVVFTISVSKANQKYLAPKASITVDGISLTVGKVKPGSFEIYLIPLTLQITTLRNKSIGDKVNLETDVLAKYILNQK